MSEFKNIAIAVGTVKGSKMRPLIQDYEDYIAEYNVEDSNSEFFAKIVSTQPSNIYSFFKNNISFKEDDSIVRIADAFNKDPNVMAVVCDGFRKNNNIKQPYYLDTNHLANLDESIPIFFHKNIVTSINFSQNPYAVLTETLNKCLSQNKLTIHIADPLIVIHE